MNEDLKNDAADDDYEQGCTEERCVAVSRKMRTDARAKRGAE